MSHFGEEWFSLTFKNNKVLIFKDLIRDWKIWSWKVNPCTDFKKIIVILPKSLHWVHNISAIFCFKVTINLYVRTFHCSLKCIYAEIVLTSWIAEIGHNCLYLYGDVSLTILTSILYGHFCLQTLWKCWFPL